MLFLFFFFYVFSLSAMDPSKQALLDAFGLTSMRYRGKIGNTAFAIGPRQDSADLAIILIRGDQHKSFLVTEGTSFIEYGVNVTPFDNPDLGVLFLTCWRPTVESFRDRWCKGSRLVTKDGCILDVRLLTGSDN